MLKIFILVLLFSLSASAQDFLSAFDAESVSTKIEVDNFSTFSPDAISNRNFFVQRTIYTNENHSVSVGAKWQSLDFHENKNGLRDYQNIQGSLNYKKFLEDKKFLNVNVSYGSASDRPFQNGRDGALGATVIKKTSAKWMWLVNYSNNRPFLNNIPLPGFVYFHTISRERALILGFPFVYWMTPIGSHLSLRYLGILPWTHRLRVLWQGLGSYEPYVGFEQSPLTYFDSRREERWDRTFWFEKKLGSGVEGKLLGTLRYDFQAGLAFDRNLYSARNFGAKKNSSLHFDSSPFVSLGLKLAF